MEKIPIIDEIERFRKHLENNPRTIFSAKFGDGKSYFLNEFKRECQEEYFIVTVFPVNYSVATNEDVFEYIKRDILLQLGEQGMLDDIDFNAFTKSLFSKENVLEVIGFLASMLPYGEVVKKLLSKGVELKAAYDEEKKTFEKFQESFSIQRGGLYERDAYSELISKCVSKIRETRKVLLLIEDLDRIDPKHLFRILNVLGAHIDCETDENKFGFDNIVVVMDYGTTEHIFHHFYGDQANYSGYMSKFLSHYPFYYSIVSIARKYLKDFITEQTGLNPDEIERGTFGEPISLSSVISEKSVRDIVKIVDGLESQYESTTLVFQNHNAINTNTKIVRLLALLTRIGFNISSYQLRESLVKQGQRGIESLEGFLLHDNNVTGGLFRIHNERFVICRRDEGPLANIRVSKGLIGTELQGDIKSHIYKAIDEALKYVYDCNVS